MRRSFVLVLLPVLAGLALLAWALGAAQRNAPELAPPSAAVDVAEPDPGALAPAPREPRDGEPGTARETVDAASAAGGKRRARSRRRVVPPLEIVVDGLPTVRLGGDRVTAIYDSVGTDARFRRDALLAPGGEGVFEGFIAHGGVDASFDVRFETASGVEGSAPVALVLADGRESLREWGADPVRLRPAEPVMAVGFFGRSGGLVRDARFRFGLYPELENDAVWCRGWVTLRRDAFEDAPCFYVRFNHLSWLATTHEFAVDADGWLRLTVDVLEANDRTLRIESTRPLPKPWAASIEMLFGDEVMQVGLATFGRCKGALRARRDVYGWTVRGLAAARYRITLTTDKRSPGRALEPVEADLRLARSARVPIEGAEFRRNRVLRLVLPDDASPVGLRPWRILVAPETQHATYLRADRGTAHFDWVGPLPRTATLVGDRGPRLPGSRSLRWEDGRVAVLDLSGERLHRCRVLPAEGAGPIHLRQPSHPRHARGGELRPAQYAVIEFDGGPEVVWWEGGDFEVIVSTERARHRSSDPSTWLAVLGPEDLAGRETYRVAARPMRTEMLRLFHSDEDPRRDGVTVYAWLSDARPPDDLLRKGALDPRDRRVSRIGHWKHGEGELAVPTAGAGVILLYEKGVLAFVPRERLASPIDVSTLGSR